MLAPKAQYDLHNAKAYFEEHLAVGDYYSEGQMVAGEWIGNGAQSLKLSGNVRMADFVALCDNENPSTGQRLTARHKTTRRVIEQDGAASEVANRRVFYDFTFSPPKSVSIVALVAGDERVVKAHDEAVRIAMQELEQFAATRVRQAGQMTDRTTSNVVAALFRHDTSRALDPHLHTHGIVFNATYDETERRWKALQNHDMLAARKYVENVYYHEIARQLRGFGYRIKNAARGDFEIEGVPQQLIATFGKRHRQIDEQTRELLNKSPALAQGNLADVREVLAQKNRAWKDKEVTIDRLREWWESQVTTEDRAALHSLQRGPSPKENQNPHVVDESLRWAEDHLFDRKSVVHEQELWRYALERSRGEAFSVEQLHEATAQAGYVVHSDNPRRLTTKQSCNGNGNSSALRKMAKALVVRCSVIGTVARNSTRPNAKRRGISYARGISYPCSGGRWHREKLHPAHRLRCPERNRMLGAGDRSAASAGEGSGAGWPERSTNRQ